MEKHIYPAVFHPDKTVGMFSHMENFTTIEKAGEAEYEIQRSHFIAQAVHAATEDEARAFLVSCKKKHYDARHNPSAWVLGAAGARQKSNDDGEPGGTAGNPILEAIKKRGLVDTVCVVTRYFGGIKLGAGGLIRAYGHAAHLALDSAVLVRCLHLVRLAVTIDYTLLSLVENFVRQENLRTEDAVYEENVTLLLLLEEEQQGSVEEKLTELTAGRAVFEKRGKAWGKAPL